MKRGIVIKMNYYNWNNNLKIIVYGVNSYSEQLVRQLRDLDFEVCAYIDRRAKELREINEIPVYDISEDFLDTNNEDKCAIIMLMNAMQHDQIAYELFCKGIKRIIFVPMEMRCDGQYADQLRRVYNLILMGDFTEIGQIPYYEDMMLDSQEQWKGTICEETQNFLTVNVIADIVYTNSREKIDGESENLLYYADVPLIAYQPYDKMFEYFWGGKDDGELTEYLNDYGVNRCKYANSYTNDNIIIQREQLYEIWNEHFQEGLAFFISSAPLAKWNDRGFFNLCEGQHRSLFLLKKGIYYLPLRISRKDWEKWKHSQMANRIKGEGHFISEITPIQNPYFQKSSFYNKISVIESMLSLQRNLPRKLYFKKTVLSFDTLLGYYGFHFRRMGAKTVTIYAEDSNKKNAVELISRLYELNGIDICSNIDWENVNKFSFISIIGAGKELKKVKYEMLRFFMTSRIEAALISLTKTEMEAVDKDIKLYLTVISKVFLETEMANIYLFRRDN